MNSRVLSLIVLLCSLCLPRAAQAEDIDLFTSSTPSTVGVPNLLFAMDNASNITSGASGTTCIIDGTATELSGKAGGIMQCALYDAINSLPVSSTATVNIGVMMMSGTGIVDYLGADTCSSQNSGGCLLYPLTPLTASSKTALLAWVKKWKSGGNGAGTIGGSSKRHAGMMQEAWAYYAGRTGLSGKNYLSSAPPVGCLKNFVVYIGNNWGPSGSPNDTDNVKAALDGSSANDITSGMRAQGTVNTALITSSGNALITSCGTLSFPNNHENTGFYADEWARYMRGSDQKIVTYTIGLKDSD
jgi:type IV pilus assembly protein PilY1